MSNKKVIDYEIKIDGYQSIKGTIKVNPKESLPSIREKIQKQAGYRDNAIQIQSPTGQFLSQNTKCVVLKQKQRHRKGSQSSIVFEQQSIIERSTSQQYMYREPEMPPRVIGRVKRCYKFFSCMSSNRLMALNFEAVRFSYNQADLQPESYINLKDIQQISSYRKQNFYFLRINTVEGQRIDFKFSNKQVCKEWIIYFNKAIQYADFLSEKKNYSKIDNYQNFIKTLEIKDKDTKIIKLDDSTLAQVSQQKSIKGEGNTIVKNNSKIIRLADYKVSYEIGKGAFSTVYKAERQGKIFALKQINKDKLIYQNQLKYAITELSILKKCGKCQFIVPLYSAFQTQNYLYIAIKYLPFGTLKSLVQKRKNLTFRQAFSVICELIVAIEFLHEKDILYRDMKPQNIMLTQQGHIYLIDFGLSIELSEQQQFAQSFVGTPLYLAPERLQGSGKINFKADIYGVGCIFYFMLHGHAPFEADSLASIIFNIKNADLKIREDIDDIALDFLKKTLQTNVDKRLGHMSTHPLFQKVDWNKIKKKQTQLMSLDLKQAAQYCGSTGTGDKDYTEQNYPNKKVNDWNYVDPQQLGNKS